MKARLRGPHLCSADPDRNGGLGEFQGLPDHHEGQGLFHDAVLDALPFQEGSNDWDEAEPHLVGLVGVLVCEFELVQHTWSLGLGLEQHPEELVGYHSDHLVGDDETERDLGHASLVGPR